MTYKVFIDINILIDLFDSQRPGHREAVKIFDEAETGGVSAYVTESVLNTVSYILRKDYSISDLITLFNHLLSFTELIPVTTPLYLKALQMVSNDIEDSILYAAALQLKVNFFITNDIKDFKRLERSVLPVMKPDSFLKLL